MPATAEPATARGELLSRVAAVLDSIALETRPIVLPGQRVRDKLTAGVPLLHGEEVYVDGGAVRATWDRLLGVLAEADEWNDQVVDVRAALAGHRLHAEHATVEALVSHPEHVREVAGTADAPIGLVALLADLAARPPLAAYAQQLAPALGLAAWERGYCPICGGWPARGERAGDGDDSRRLRCGRCVTGWAARVTACPFCGLAEPLRTPEPSTDEGRQTAEVGYGTAHLGCRACERWLPLVDASADPPTFADLLDRGSVSLTRDASQSGPGGISPAGAGFRLELADGEAEWDGFDDD